MNNPTMLPVGAPAVKVSKETLDNLSVTISSGGIQDFIFTPTAIDGYTVSGIVGLVSFASNTPPLAVRRFGYFGSGINASWRVTLQNCGSGSNTVTQVSADFLYVKN